MPNRPAIPMSFRPGDDEAFTKVFDEFYLPLCFFATRLLNRDEEAAEDVVSEVFLKLLEQKGHYESYLEIKGWLYISTKNKCFNYLKRINRNAASEKGYALVSEHEEKAVLAKITKAEVVKEIYILIEGLPPGCRKIMRLSYFEGLDNEGIAHRLKLSVHTVKNQKARGIMLIRKRIVELGLFELLVFFPFFYD